MVFSDEHAEMVAAQQPLRRRNASRSGWTLPGQEPAAGRYYAIAVDYLAQGEWNDPDVLERLKAKATSFSLDEGETKTLESDAEVESLKFLHAEC